MLNPNDGAGGPLPGYEDGIHIGATLWLVARLVLALYLVASALSAFDHGRLGRPEIAARLALAGPVMAGPLAVHGPAILARAGLGPYNGVQGQSLLDCLDGSGAVREDLLIEFNDGGTRLGFETPARARVLMTGRYRFTLYGGQNWGELYDLAEDPDETVNLWDDPGHSRVKAELSPRLNHRLTALMDESPRSTRVA